MLPSIMDYLAVYFRLCSSISVSPTKLLKQNANHTYMLDTLPLVSPPFPLAVHLELRWLYFRGEEERAVGHEW